MFTKTLHGVIKLQYAFLLLKKDMLYSACLPSNEVESKNGTIFIHAGLWPRVVQLAIWRMRLWWSFGGECPGGRRSGKKKIPSEPGCCPVCGVTVRSGELESHFVQELERLYKLSAVNRGRRQPLGHPITSNSNRRTDTLASTADGTPEGRWDEPREGVSGSSEQLHEKMFTGDKTGGPVFSVLMLEKDLGNDLDPLALILPLETLASCS
uniref:E3 ubiquitin-protein ligase RNF220 middle domain-containing protein n=1 Tax=Timema douglasi TaxID=61478 RepID=A0A7R8VJ80_TIMDO|nr:unnamed protein product [Timema douglasi]